MNATDSKTVYAVLLYPPHGKPRVIAVPAISVRHPMHTFKTVAKAEAALAKFLDENPEYRNWRDGMIQQ